MCTLLCCWFGCLLSILTDKLHVSECLLGFTLLVSGMRFART